MIRKKEKGKIFFWLRHGMYFLVGFFILVLLFFPLFNKISKKNNLNNEIKDLNAEIERLEGGNKKLKNMVAFLESDEFTEEEARLNLNLKKEGEEVVVIKTRNEEKQGTHLVKNLEINKKNNIKNWLNYFFN